MRELFWDKSGKILRLVSILEKIYSNLGVVYVYCRCLAFSQNRQVQVEIKIYGVWIWFLKFNHNMPVSSLNSVHHILETFVKCDLIINY